MTWDEEAETIALFREAGLLPGAEDAPLEYQRAWDPVSFAEHDGEPVSASSNQTESATPDPITVPAKLGGKTETLGGSHGRQGESMGDDRAPVYQEGDIWVYRASSVWRCDRELWAWRQGMEGQPVPDWLQEKFDQGNVGEDPILAEVESQLGEQVGMRQATVEMKVGKTMIVRGHVDGVCDDSLIEAKTMAEQTYNTKWLRAGLKGFPGYAAQVAVYCHALGLDGVQMAIGVKDDKGKVERVKLFYYPVAALPVGYKDVKKKLMRLARMEGEMPVCDVDQYPCAFFDLHDEKPIVVSGDEILQLYAKEIFECRSRKKRAEDELQEWAKLMAKQIDTLGLEGTFTAGKYTITDVIRKQVGRLDYAAMERDGVELEKYRGDGSESRYQTVKIKDAKDGGPDAQLQG